MGLESQLIEVALSRVANNLPVVINVDEPVRCCGEDVNQLLFTSLAKGPSPAAQHLARLLCDRLSGQVEDPTHPPQLWVATVASCFALAANQHEGLEAAVIGLEVAVRLADGLKSSAPAAVWDVPGIAGAIAAVLACSRILELSKSSAATALAMSVAQSPRFVVDGVLRSFLVGRTAAASVEAALAGRAGLSAPEDPITGTRGLLTVLGVGGVDTIEGWGQAWRSRSLLASVFSVGEGLGDTDGVSP